MHDDVACNGPLKQVRMQDQGVKDHGVRLDNPGGGGVTCVRFSRCLSPLKQEPTKVRWTSIFFFRDICFVKKIGYLQCPGGEGWLGLRPLKQEPIKVTD